MYTIIVRLTLPKVLPTKNANILAFSEVSLIQAIESDTDLTSLERLGSFDLSIKRVIAEEPGLGTDVVPSVSGTTPDKNKLGHSHKTIEGGLLTNTDRSSWTKRTSARTEGTRRCRGWGIRECRLMCMG